MRLGVDATDSDLLVLSGALNRGEGSGYQIHFAQGGALPVVGTTYSLITAASTDFGVADLANITYDALPPMKTINGTFSLDGATLQFTVNSVTSDVIFKNGFTSALPNGGPPLLTCVAARSDRSSPQTTVWKAFPSRTKNDTTATLRNIPCREQFRTFAWSVGLRGG